VNEEGALPAEDLARAYKSDVVKVVGPVIPSRDGAANFDLVAWTEPMKISRDFTVRIPFHN
jgi:hypothetical protein